MSAPKRAMRDAHDIEIGFLAAKASLALRNALSGQLSADDRAALRKAAELLDEIATGAQRAKGAVLQGVRPSRSMAALHVAFGPIDTLKKLVNQDQEGLLPMFQRLSQAVRAAESNGNLEEWHPSLNHAQEFFSGLSDWHASALASRKRARGQDRSRSL